MYVTKLNRNDFEFRVSDAEYGQKGELISPKQVVALRGDDERSRMTIDAILRVIGKADGLQCIVDDKPIANGHEIVVTHVDTMKTATVTLKYAGDNYSASVVLGHHRQVSFKAGAKKAAETIEQYLVDKKTKTRNIPLVGASVGGADDDDQYTHWEQEFEE